MEVWLWFCGRVSVHVITRSECPVRYVSCPCCNKPAVIQTGMIPLEIMMTGSTRYASQQLAVFLCNMIVIYSHVLCCCMAGAGGKPGGSHRGGCQLEIWWNCILWGGKSHYRCSKAGNYFAKALVCVLRSEVWKLQRLLHHIVTFVRRKCFASRQSADPQHRAGRPRFALKVEHLIGVIICAWTTETIWNM